MHICAIVYIYTLQPASSPPRTFLAAFALAVFDFAWALFNERTNPEQACRLCSASRL